MQSTGIIKPGTNPRDGIFNSDIDAFAHQGIGGVLSDDTSEVENLRAAHSTPEYLAFSQHPAFKSFRSEVHGLEGRRGVRENAITTQSSQQRLNGNPLRQNIPASR